MPLSTAYERGGVHQRPSLGALTFLPPRPSAAAAAAAAAAASRAPSERPPPPGRPPVPVKSERSRGKPKAKVYSHYACPAAVQLPDFNQAVPHMRECSRGYVGRRVRDVFESARILYRALNIVIVLLQLYRHEGQMNTDWLIHHQMLEYVFI